MVVFAARDPLSKDIYVCLLCLEEICLQSGDKWLPLWQLSHLIIVIAIVIVFVFAFFCVFVFVWVMLTNDSVLWQLPLTPSFFLSHLIFSSIWPHFSLFMALSASQTIVFLFLSSILHTLGLFSLLCMALQNIKQGTVIPGPQYGYL